MLLGIHTGVDELPGTQRGCELSLQKESNTTVRVLAALRGSSWMELRMPCWSTLVPQNSFCSLTLEMRECSWR